jgi:hypothetical protein
MFLDRSRVNFIAAKVAPEETTNTFWIDLSSDPVGKTIKAFDGKGWVFIDPETELEQKVEKLLSEVGSLDLEELNRIQQAVDGFESQVDANTGNLATEIARAKDAEGILDAAKIDKSAIQRSAINNTRTVLTGVAPTKVLTTEVEITAYNSDVDQAGTFTKSTLKIKGEDGIEYAMDQDGLIIKTNLLKSISDLDDNKVNKSSIQRNSFNSKRTVMTGLVPTRIEEDKVVLTAWNSNVEASEAPILVNFEMNATDHVKFVGQAGLNGGFTIKTDLNPILAATATEIATIFAEITDLHTQDAAFATEIATLHAKDVTIDTELATVASRLTDLEYTDTTYATEIASIHSEIATLHSVDATHAAEIATLYAQDTAFATEIADLHQQDSTHTKAIATLEAKIATNATAIATNAASLAVNATDIAARIKQESIQRSAYNQKRMVMTGFHPYEFNTDEVKVRVYSSDVESVDQPITVDFSIRGEDHIVLGGVAGNNGDIVIKTDLNPVLATTAAEIATLQARVQNIVDNGISETKATELAGKIDTINDELSRIKDMGHVLGSIADETLIPTTIDAAKLQFGDILVTLNDIVIVLSDSTKEGVSTRYTISNIDDLGAITWVYSGAYSTAQRNFTTHPITTVEITDSNVTTDKLTDSSVTTVKLATGAITNEKLADSSVTSIKVEDYSISSGKLYWGAVIATTIASNAVTDSKIGERTFYNTTPDGTLMPEGEYRYTEAIQQIRNNLAYTWQNNASVATSIANINTSLDNKVNVHSVGTNGEVTATNSYGEFDLLHSYVDSNNKTNTGQIRLFNLGLALNYGNATQYVKQSFSKSTLGNPLYSVIANNGADRLTFEITEKNVTINQSKVLTEGMLATVATTGSYSDLSGTPTLPTKLPNIHALSYTADSVSDSYDGETTKTLIFDSLALNVNGATLTPTFTPIKTSGVYEIKYISLPNYPTKLPNPSTFTLGSYTYDGSTNVSATFPAVPTTLKNPYTLTLGSYTYDGSVTVNATFPAAVKNPYSLVLGSYTYDGSVSVNATFPASLKNPSSLTITNFNGTVQTYDGSSAVSVDLSSALTTSNANWFGTKEELNALHATNNTKTGIDYCVTNE